MTFNINNVICINLKAINEQQLFFFSEKYLFDFEIVLSQKIKGTNKIWFDWTVDEYIIAYEYNDPEKVFKVTENYSPLTKKMYDALLKIKPAKIPSIPTNDSTLGNYLHFLEKGYNIKTNKLDNIINSMSKCDNLDLVEEIGFELNVDDILDKIANLGMYSLSENELDFLKDKYKKK